MTRPATKTESLVVVLSCLIFAEAALSQGLSNLYRITVVNTLKAAADYCSGGPGLS